jgi:hypothetical protein
VRGAWCSAADLDRCFRLRAHRRVNAHGFVRFRHWRVYGERGLAGREAAVWVLGETLTIEYATEALAQYRLTYEADGRHIRAVSEPRLFATRHQSPQSWLPRLEALDWQPARQLSRYRARRIRQRLAAQLLLFPPADESPAETEA